jgi:phospholipid/cholesterol/gamma-HCH transport system substrate-binding protein
MKISITQKIKIGIFAFIGIILLLIGILIIGLNKNMFGGTYTLYGAFRNVGGLQVGNNVRFAGINVGTVEDITILNDTTIRVDMRLQTRVRKFIKADATASIGSDGLMGDKLITIAPGTYDQPALKNGAYVRSVNPIEMDKIVARLSNVVENVENVSEDVASITNHIASGKGSLGKLLYDDKLATSLEGTVQTANQTMKSIKSGSEDFGDNMKAMKHNFLLRGYFKRKEREKQEKKERQEAEQQQKATEQATPPASSKKKK